MKQIGKTLYALNKDKSYQEWKIFVSTNTFTVHYGKENGKIQTKTTNCYGKNIGKSNETTDEEQALLEAEAKYRDQIRKGYKENKQDLSVDVTSPMLAQDASKKPHLIKYPCTVSPKLDGCFSYPTKIITNIGVLPIGYIVDNKIKCKALSYNEKEDKFEYKNIVSWFNNGEKPQEDWLKFNKYGDNQTTIITKNHKVLTSCGWIKAEHSEDILTINPKFQGIITGMLLGDTVASFEKRHRTTGNFHSWRLRYSTSKFDEPYGDKKSKMLKNIYFSKKNRLSGYEKDVIDFTSSSCSSIPYDIGVFYNTDRATPEYGTRNKKISAKDLSNIFTDESLALWFFDDGSLHYNNGDMKTPRIFLSVARYSDETLDEFVKLFNIRYNVKPSIGLYGKDKRLSFTTVDSLYILWRISICCGGLLPRKLPSGLCSGNVTPENVPTTVYEKFERLPVTRKTSSRSRTAYDIEVEENHNYIANDRIVHNCRCLVTFDSDGEPVFNSRGGKEYPKHRHLVEQLKNLRKQTGFDSFDGEFYIHGSPLQNIVSLVKKVQPASSELNYYVFDIPSDKVWDYRADESRCMDVTSFLFDTIQVDKCSFPNIEVVPAYISESEESVKKTIGQFMQEGYEGTIVRNLDGKYEYGQRSNNLLKWKLFESGEAEVFDVEQDKNQEGVLCCKLKNGVVFKCKMKGTHEQRSYENQLKLIGKYITFTYQTLTVDGVPQFPVGICVRELNSNWEPLE